jgi:hypothetical protein
LPGPDITALRDDIEYLPNSDYYIPAVMQCLHYYTELMQYELMQNPFQDPIITTTKPRPTTTTVKTTPKTTTTTSRRTTTTTTKKPTTTTTIRKTTTTGTTTTTSRTTKRTTTTLKPTPFEIPYVTEQTTTAMMNFSREFFS